MRTLPIARSSSGSATGARGRGRVGGTRPILGASSSTIGLVVRPFATIGGLAALQGVEACDDGREFCLCGGATLSSAWHRPSCPRRWPLGRMVGADEARRVGESEQDSRGGAAAALPAMPRRFQRALRRDAAAASGNGREARPVRRRGRPRTGCGGLHECSRASSGLERVWSASTVPKLAAPTTSASGRMAAPRPPAAPR